MRLEIVLVCTAVGLAADAQMHSQPRFLSMMDTLFPLQSPSTVLSNVLTTLGSASNSASKLAKAGLASSVDRIGEIDTGYGSGLVEKVVSAILSMFGLEGTGMGRMTVSVLVFLADQIGNYLAGNSLLGDNLPRFRAAAEKGFIPFTTEIIEDVKRKGRELQYKMMDEELTDNMIHTLQENTGSSTSCVQLFLCKMAPLVRTVKQTVEDSRDFDYRSLYGSSQQLLGSAWMRAPSLRAFTEYGHECENQYPTCPLLNFTAF